MKLPTAGDDVPKPEDYDLVAWYDLSPMRPDEYARTVAGRWLEMVNARIGIEDGIAQARDEAKARDALMASDPGRAG